MTAGMLGFIGGLTAAMNLPAGPAAVALPALALLSVLLVLPRPVTRALGGVGLGVLWGAAALAIMHQARPPPAGLDDAVAVTGEITGLVEREGERTRFRLQPETIRPYPDHRPLPRSIRVSWYGNATDIAPGERWRLMLRLERPRGLMNPVPFDYERYLAARRIDATAYVTDADAARRLGSRPSTDAWRGRIADQLQSHAPEQPGTAVWRAVTIGDRRGLGDDAWQTLRRTGTAHLVAISGLHIGLLAAIGWIVGRQLTRLVPRLADRVPARIPGGLLAVSAAACYAQLAGWALPTLRAFLMLALGVVAVLARCRWSPLHLLVLAMAVMAAADPWRVLSAGFWLSFGAVGLILAGLATAPANTGRLAMMIRLQCLLSPGMAVLTLVFFGEAAWLSLPVNLVAIPLFTLLVVPAALVAAAVVVVLPGTTAADMCATLVSDMFNVVMSVLTRLGTSAGVLDPVGAGYVAMALALALVLWWLRGLVPLPFSLFAAAALAVPGAKTDGLRLSVLEVGQGSAVVVTVADYTLVYDTGPSWGDTAAARFSLWPYLQTLGRTRIDDVVISHGDSDHAGGWPLLRRQADPARVITGPGLDADGEGCHAGQNWQRAGVRFRMLWPPDQEAPRGNAGSCVLLIETDNQRFLLTGDIGTQSEAAVIERLHQPVDFVLVPHHGSSDASSKPFVRALSPAVAAISAGHDNAYGLPNPAVVERYRCQGARVLVTGRHGAVTVRADGDESIRVSARRRDWARLYHSGIGSTAFNAQEVIEYDPLRKGIPNCREETR